MHPESSGAARLLNRLSWLVVYASAVALLVLLARFGRGAWPLLPYATAMAFVAGFLGRKRAGQATGAAILASIYLVPALFMLASIQFFWSMHAVWLAALLGWIGWSSPGWASERPLRAPLALWALSVALSAVVVVLRETDFSLAGLEARTATSLGQATSLTLQWIAFTAAGTLVGILWLDRQLRWYAGQPRRAFEREIVVPLAASWIVTACVGAYQAYGDPAFLNRTFWLALGRVPGTLQDANLFGALCGMWGPALAGVLAARRDRSGTLAAAVVLSLGWIGVWASGSRGALVVASAGSLAAVVAAGRRLGGGRFRTLPILIGSIVFLAAALWLARDSGPVHRLASQFDDLRRSPAAAARDLWDRDGWGTASVSMIREHPWVGIGVGNFHHTVRYYSPPELGYKLPPDNAQNWYRHQVAELGFLGSAGALWWTLAMAWLLGRRLLTRHSPREVDPVGWVVAAFGLISLVAMPGQHYTVGLTFWTFAAWFILGSSDAERRAAAPRREWIGWAATWAIALAFTALTAAAARGDLRPPFRAARFDLDYSYGFTGDAEGQAWTARKAVTVLKAESGWLKLTYWVEHPDAAQRPVQVDIWRDRERVVNRRLWRNMRFTDYIPVTAGKRFVLETRVDRGFVVQDTAGSGERGLSLRLEFVEKPE